MRRALVAAIVGASVGFALPLPIPAIASEANPGCQPPSVPAEPLSLTAGLGPQGAHTAIIEQGEGTVLAGSLTAGATPVSGAFLCVYSRVLSDSETSLMGLAVTRPDGSPARSKHFVDISGRIPGPDNDRFTVILEAADRARTRWFEFRSASTHDDGRFALRYFFGKTPQASTYMIRAKVLGAPGYPYEGGISREIPLRVRP